ENAHHPEREERRVPHQEEKLLFPDRGHGAVGQGDDGRAARTVVNKGHLAKNAVLAQSFEATVAAPDLDLSAHDDEELIAMFALLEDQVSFGELAGQDLRPHEKTEIDLILRHLVILSHCTNAIYPRTACNDRPIA